MKLEFEVELADSPGQLSRLLDVVAAHGANVQSVLHRHERAIHGHVPVAVGVEVQETDAIRLLDALARSHRLLRVNREGGPAHTALLLVGHVFEADIRKLIDAAFEKDAEVHGVDARIAGRDNPSAVLIRLSAPDDTKLRAAVEALRAGAAPHQVTLIEEARGERLG